MKILIASDHAGFELKEKIKQLLKQYTWKDIGPMSLDRVDYPDFAEKLSREVAFNPGSLGILACGSGIGMSIAANKVNGIRAALVENPVAARLAKEHNDANILCIGSRFVAPEYASEIIEAFIKTPFTKDDRHQKRIDKIAALEKMK